MRKVFWGRATVRSQQLAEEFGGEAYQRSFGDAVEALDVDAVLITTPPDTHLDFTLEALGAGRHVIVEKPAFLDDGEFDRVEAAASAARRTVLVAENYFYKPLLRLLRRVIAGDTLGQIRLIEINAVKRQPVSGWRIDPARAGGGALFEGGIHWVSLMANLGLEIRAAHGYFPDAPPGYERSAVFVAEYLQGATGVLTYSWEIPGTLRGLRLSRIWGTRSSLLFESNGLFVVRGGARPRLWAPGLLDIQGYRAMLADFLRALSTGGAPAFTLAAARRDVELVRSAYAISDQPPFAGTDN